MANIESGNGIIYPAGYDHSGRSLHYNADIEPDERIPLKSRILRFGSVTDLVIMPPFPPVEPIKGGIREYIRTSFGERQVPVYIFDHHNHAFFGWFEAFKEGRIAPGAVLRHFDRHADDNFHSITPLIVMDLQQAADCTRGMSIASFIIPAVQMGLVANDFHWIKPYASDKVERMTLLRNMTEQSIKYLIMNIEAVKQEQFDGMDPKKLIVDIDLDYFVQIVAQERDTLERMRFEMARAGVVTMVTSPGHVDQDKALRLIRELLK